MWKTPFCGRSTVSGGWWPLPDQLEADEKAQGKTVDPVRWVACCDRLEGRGQVATFG
jgi:hypothetical protein